MDLGFELVLLAEQASQVSEQEIGGKAMGLSRLQRAGARVPPWCVVGAFGLHAHLLESGALARVRAGFLRLSAVDPKSPAHREVVEEVAADLMRAILDPPVPRNVACEIRRALPVVGEGPYAVRSSMAGEDSAQHSFAGQLESYLFQRHPEEVIDSVKRCWASAFAERALTYRLRIGRWDEMPCMGVVIQRMIAGEVSGVAFSAHPTTGRRDQVLITAAFGLGEGIVGGLCNTDDFVYQPGVGEVSVSIADKDLAILANPSGASGTTEVKVDEDRRHQRCLQPKQVEEVGAEVARIAAWMGRPQDLEWTFAGGTLYLLQSRPITSLPTPDNQSGPRVVFDNSNIQESYCGVTTPLTFSFASQAYANVYEQTFRLLGVKGDRILAMRPVLRNLLGLIRGRVYYNINNWYRSLLVLPSFGRNKADMEHMIGLQDPVDFVEDQVLSPWEKLSKSPRMVFALLRLVRQFQKLPRNVPRFLDQFEVSYRKLDRGRLPQAAFSEIIATIELLYQEILNDWTIPIMNDFWVMMSMGKLRRFVAASGVEDPNALINNLMTGEDGIESTEPTRQIMRLARDAQRDPALAQVVRQGAPGEGLRELAKRHPKFLARIDAYIERYGDRVIGELKLETVTLREDASFLIHVIRNYLDRPDLDPDELAAREKRLRKEAEDLLRSRLSWFGRFRMKKTLRAARTSVKYRENMRLARTRGFGLLRDCLRFLGQRFHEVGVLEAPRDIFFLTVDEIFAYHEGRAVSADLAGLVRARQAEYEGYAGQDLPHHFETVGPVYHGNRYEGPKATKSFDPQGKVLKGIGCYPGVVESQVRVILTPKEELSVNGKILATIRTDPGWAPLFPTTCGILVERGSTLSHSAVVARELGIPAIVGIPNLIQIIKDGEEVRMDGGKGTLERLGVQLDSPTPPKDPEE